MSCIRCNCPSELLLNLVRCVSPRCQFFDKHFYSKWLSKCGRSFKAGDPSWKFLGIYTPTLKFKTYHYELYAHGAETYAVFGGDEGKTFIGDSEGSPLGYHLVFWCGPEVVDAAGVEALQEAAARSKI